MIQWILILCIYSGALSKTDSVALLSVPGFNSEEECFAAGNKTSNLTTLFKGNKFVCVQQERQK